MTQATRVPADATALAADFAAGRVHPRAAMEGTLERIARLGPLVGACNHVTDRASLLAAADAAGTRWERGTARSDLDGIPFGVKANIAVRGLPWHAGIAAFRERVAQVDAACVVRLRTAGLIPVAMLNMHEAALGETSDNPAFATTRNPWALERIPGGSSGGSAAAVASGMLPLALGTDDLGSVRLPSALCGVVGFKPAYGEIPVKGVVPLSPGLDHVGIHARSVRDVALVLPILRGRPDEPGPVASGAEPPIAPWLLGDPDIVEPDVRAACHAALQAAGPLAPAVDWSETDTSALRRAGLLRCERDAAGHFAAALRKHSEGFSAGFRRLVSWGAAQDSAKVGAASERLRGAARSLRRDLGGRLLAGPTTPHIAPRRSAPTPTTLADFTAAPAIAGVPAISVPVPNPGGPMPVGLQIVGLRARDVLAAAARVFPGTAAIAEPDRGATPLPSSDARGSP